MPLSPDPEAALAQVREIALALPESEERPSHSQPTFFAADKMFAQFRHDHHGDGRTVVIVKAGDAEEAASLIENLPDRYSRPAYFRAGWVAIDLAAEDTDWIHVGDRIARSWELAAPRRLLEAGGR
ncbi:MAG: MmcQ/YjbR family DNA-binding protein [Sphingomonas sp.]